MMHGGSERENEMQRWWNLCECAESKLVNQLVMIATALSVIIASKYSVANTASANSLCFVSVERQQHTHTVARQHQKGDETWNGPRPNNKWCTKVETLEEELIRCARAQIVDGDVSTNWQQKSFCLFLPRSSPQGVGNVCIELGRKNRKEVQPPRQQWNETDVWMEPSNRRCYKWSSGTSRNRTVASCNTEGNRERNDGITRKELETATKQLKGNLYQQIINYR